MKVVELTNSTSTDQIARFFGSFADKIAGDISKDTTTHKYHGSVGKSSILQNYASSTDSPVTPISSKFQINEVEKTEASDPPTQTSTAFEMEASADNKQISNTNPKIDNFQNLDTILHVLKITLPSNTTSLLLSESSSTYDDTYTTTDDAIFLMETKLHSINLDSTTSSTTVDPLPFSNASEIDEMLQTATEGLTSTEMNENTRSTTTFLTRNIATNLETTTISVISPSDINDFSYSLQDSIHTSTSINLNAFTNPQISDEKESMPTEPMQYTASTSLSSNDEERLTTTSKPLTTGNFQQSTSTDSLSFAETSGTTKATGSSETFVDSDLSTIVTTDSSDDATVVSFTTAGNDELVNNTESPSVHTVSIPVSDTSQTIETSMISSSSMENLIESSTVAQASDEITITAEKIPPLTVFNLTLPALQYDGHISSHIDRTNYNYNSLLLDEVSYAEKVEAEALDPSKITFVMDDEPTLLDDLENDANETYNDFYSDNSISSQDNDTMVRERFRLANLALRNKYKMESESKSETTTTDGSTQDTVTVSMGNVEHQRRSASSTGSDSSSSHFRNNEIPTNTLKSIESSVISQDLKELKNEIQGANSNQQEVNTTENANTKVSQIRNSIKLDFTTLISDESFNVPIDSSKAANGVDENPSNTLPLNYVPSRATPEVEKIAVINANYRNIVYQTPIILETEKSISNDSSFSITSTLKPIASSSSDQISTDELSATSAHSHLQFQTNESTIIRNEGDKRQGINDKNDNAADIFQKSTTGTLL